MPQIYRLVTQVSWVLGLLSMLAALLIKLLHLEPKVNVAGSNVILGAAALFLCVLATREMQRSS